MIELYKFAGDRDYGDKKFQAALQGVDLDKVAGGEVGVSSSSGTSTTPFRFGSEEDYGGLTDDEKQELTEKMMAKHSFWVKAKKVPL